MWSQFKERVVHSFSLNQQGFAQCVRALADLCATKGGDRLVLSRVLALTFQLLDRQE